MEKPKVEFIGAEPAFNPVETLKRWPHKINWKITAIGLLLIIGIMGVGIWYSSRVPCVLG